MLNLDDTIAAIASPPSGAVRGVLRVSGPGVVDCLTKCFSPTRDRSLQEVSRASVLPGLLHVKPPVGDLECEVYLWPDQRSYTRQPAAELHTFGSPPLLEAALQTLCASGARLAGPGEFTMRAFLAGRLDLTQAEAILGVIDAQSDHELRVALAQMAGGLATPLNELRGQLLDLLAHLEAGLDFVEDDIEFISTEELNASLSSVVEQVAALADRLDARQQQEGIPRVVLRGWPNVGKSSLLNALAGSDTAIVSHHSGTTRDFLTCKIRAEGREILLIDTAGVETEESSRLSLAAQRAREMQEGQADLRLFCIDAMRPLNAWEQSQLAHTAHPTPQLVVLTKIDLSSAIPPPVSGIRTSSRTGEGLDTLRQAIAQRLESLPGRETIAVSATAARCRESLRLTGQCLQRSLESLRQHYGEELIAADIRSALEELGKIVGAVYTDDILDRIFGRFCIGK
jgi:tRNA modification GTPase